MARPADWEWRPLGLDSDPVPGDPARIGDEARHLAAVATEISNQVAALRKIAAAGDEVGQHADEIRSSASDLAGQLDKVVGRYQKVSSALNGWIPDLQRAQAMSIQALNAAQGPYKQLNQTVALPSGPNLTPEQRKSVQDYHDSMRRASSDLAAAQAQLHRATSLRDSSGSHYAGLIKSACDDGMKDSWWDQFKDWVSSFSKFLQTVCTILEIIATIAAIAAFILAQFVPGLDVLVDALVLGAIITTAVAASGRLLLAATGNGSWLDFAIDAFSLATFGVGRLAGSIAKGMEETVVATSRAGLTAELADAVMQESPRGMMIIKYAQMQGVSALEMAGRLGKFAPSLANDAKLAGAMKVMGSLGAFGEEGSTYAKLLTLGGRFTNDFADLSHVTSVTKTLLTVSGGSAGVAGLAGATAPVLGGFDINAPDGSTVFSYRMPGVSQWWEEHLATPMTGAISTGAANVAVDVATVADPAVGIPMQAYRYTHGG